MSKQLVSTKLPEYDGPLEAIGETRLHQAYETRMWCGLDLNTAAFPLPSYVHVDRPTTEDGYEWFWAYHFRAQSGLFAILLPWA